MNGYIVKGIGGFYYVKTAEGIVECKPRGIFRKQKITPVAGDEVTRRHFLPLRHGMLADFRAVRAARVEFAALRRVDRAGDIALEHRKVALLLRRRDGFEQSLGIRMHRVVEDLL